MHRKDLIGRSLKWLVLSALAALSWESLAATPRPAAEIVSLQGKGEYREPAEPRWREAAVRQKLSEGHFVRTGDASRMAVLLVDQTQIRLAANSMMQIKQAGDNRDRGTVIKQHSGRSWTQSKNIPNKLSVETPSVLASIRGTDWELVVDEDGTSTLTVLSGEVLLSNEQGSVNIGPGEQGRAQPGLAPVKRVLQNPRDRVQWVSSFTVDARRYRELDAPIGAELKALDALLRQGDHAAARRSLEPLVSQQIAVVSLLRADYQLMDGEFDAAIATLRDGAAQHPGDERFDVWRARLHLLKDEITEARMALASARTRKPNSAEVMIAEGELERFEGSAPAATAAYLAALAAQPGIASLTSRAWHGLGIVQTEREDLAKARASLNQALSIDPPGAGLRGELGTLEAFADQLTAARAAFTQALEERPDDYVALTGLGLVEIKAGNTAAAITHLLAASLIEPRYARAQTTLAVAYYQQGRVRDALFALSRARQFDPKDPLPDLLESAIHNDQLRPGEALVSARRALTLLPYLKSLNQLANDLRGSANLGAGLAQFGLEDWALHYALQSYNPFWAGTHFFLADRYSDPFLKNSEFMLGFLTDPLAMGASNRQDALVRVPGHYRSIGWNSAASHDNHTATLTLRANGYVNSGLPLAYSLELQQTDIRPQDSPVSASGPFFTGGVGARLSDTLTGFIFGNHLGARIDDVGVNMSPCLSRFLQAADSNRCRIDATLDRLDTGLAWRPSSSEALWLKLGATREDATIDEVTRQSNGPKSDQASVPRNARDMDLRYTWRPRDTLELTVGAEAARLANDEHRAINETVCNPFRPGDCGQSLTREQDRLRERSQLAYAGAQFDAPTHRRNGGWRLAVLLGESRYRLRHDAAAVAIEGGNTSTLTSLGQEIARRTSVSMFTLQARPGPGQVLSLATQRWLQPVVPYTLIPLQWGGVSLDTAWLVQGGLQWREVAQWHWESSPRSYSVITLDRQRIDNVYDKYTGNLVQPLSNEARLERLRASAGSDLLQDSLEGEPRFAEGWLKRAKWAVNSALNEQWSLLARVQFLRSENTFLRYRGKALPYAPRRQMSLGTTWSGQERWQLGALATYRSERYSDQENLNHLHPGWGLDLRAFRESADRAWRVEGYVNDIARKDTVATAGVRMAYRF